jgi:hypothetical protein
MSPVIQHLCAVVSELPQACSGSPRQWTFDESLKQLGPDFYNKILPLHPLLNIEYSILCTQLRQDLLEPEFENRKQIMARLATALLYCELLEYVHMHYLIVPREVVRLRQQRQLFRTLLAELDGYSFSSTLNSKELAETNYSWSQTIRDATMRAHWYRILINRSKRVVNMLNNVITNSQTFNAFVSSLDRHTNSFLAYFSLWFHVPRLLTNSFLIAKHTVPGYWMNEEERSLDLYVRLLSQIQRRWFEMGNDLVWTTVSAVNIFVFLGVLTPGALYLNAAAFAFDMIHATTRAYIELTRLYTLQQEYNEMLATEPDSEQQTFIRNHLNYIANRIQFEHTRLGIHVFGNVFVFAAMSLTMPVLAMSPAVILASAIFLVLLWGISFTLTTQLENERPNERIEVTSGVCKLGFFAAKKQELFSDIDLDESKSDINQLRPI